MVKIEGAETASWLGTGHYGIARGATASVRVRETSAVRRDARSRAPVRHAELADLLDFGHDLISYDAADLSKSDFETRLSEDGAGGVFIPLADVPDVIWKQLPKTIDPVGGRVGGRDTSRAGRASNGAEHPNHYADVDVSVDGEATWRDRCIADPELINPDTWIKSFYDKPPSNVAPLRMGLLPFRVWQLFEGMVDYLRAGNLTGFLATAGVCAHYVGDAAQPLHGSYLSDGDPSRKVIRLGSDGKPDSVDYGHGVHLAYEGTLITRNAPQVIPGLTAVTTPTQSTRLIESGHGAAWAVLKLMRGVAETLPPIDIVNCYQSARTKYEIDGGAAIPQDQSKTSAIASDMWDELGTRTIDVMRQGSATLAYVWESAWAAGGGNDIPADQLDLQAITREGLRAMYVDPNFMPSKRLDEIKELLRPWRPRGD